MLDSIITAHSKLLAAITEYEQEASSAISKIALEGDMARVAELAGAINSLQEIRAELTQQKKPLKHALEQVQAQLKSHTKEHQTALRVVIQNFDGTTSVFAKKNAADTLNQFVSWAVSHGDSEQNLRALIAITKGGQQLVSRSPQRDFVNPKQGAPYSYQQIPGTGWFLRTQTSTKDKVTQIEEIIQILGLNRHRIDIETFAK